jgi:MFS family permease
MASRPDRRHVAWLIVILLAGLGLRLLFAPWLSGNDDLALAGPAIDLLRHGWSVPGSNYGADYGMTVPLAIVFGTFGIGLHQLGLLPLLAALAGIYAAWRIGTILFDPIVGLAAAAAFACYPMSVEFSTLFFPDQPQGVAMGLAFLCALNSTRAQRGALWWAIAAGAWWAYAYYVRIDAFFLGFVFLAAVGFGYLRWPFLFVIGAVTGSLVGIELVVFDRLTGNPFYHAYLEHRAANEVLSPTMNYRDLMTYPKAMFLTPYDVGLHFYLLAAGMVGAVLRRHRAALMLTVWVAIFLVWLMFGVDPFSHPIRLKPQVSRYLLEICVPMNILIGWGLVGLYRHAARAAAITIAAAALLVAVVFMQFDLLNFEPAAATVHATEAAEQHGWFPLYADSQSSGIVAFLLHDSPLAARAHPAQEHNFLTGTTSFARIPGQQAYLLINQDYVRQLQQRNLETPITPDRFGMTPTLLYSVDNPEPPLSYAILRGLTALARALPVPGLSAHIEATAHTVLLPGDARIFRLRRTP